MTETTPRSESSPAGRMIPNVESMHFKNNKVVEGPRPDTAYADDLGGRPVAYSASATTTTVKKGLSLK